MKWLKYGEKKISFKSCSEFNCKHAKPSHLFQKWQNQCTLCNKWLSCFSSGKLISAHKSVFFE
jgi:hypothetical protein